MKPICLSTGILDYKFLRQTPGRKGIVGDYQFYENDELNECEYWVVFNNLVGEQTKKVKSGKTILFTAEPATILSYPKEYLNQFDYVVGVQEEIQHPGFIQANMALPWHAGIIKSNDLNHKITQVPLGYDEFKNFNQKKNKLISVISSAKVQTEGHRKRLEFVKGLKEHFGEELDLFGAGLNHIEDKWDALKDYKYHIALENSSFNDYWTEKLSDPYLAGCYPIYYGCPNIYDYFDKGALSTINVDDLQGSIQKIEQILSQDLYNKNQTQIQGAKSLVLDKYNLFPAIINLISDKVEVGNEKTVRLKPIHTFLPQPKISFSSKVKNKLKSIFK